MPCNMHALHLLEKRKCVLVDENNKESVQSNKKKKKKNHLLFDVYFVDNVTEKLLFQFC